MEERVFKAIVFGVPSVILGVAALTELQRGSTALVGKGWTRAFFQGNVPWLLQSLGVFAFIAYQDKIVHA